MKSIKSYIKESVDDNLFWKIDTFFYNNEPELKEFNNLVDYCRDHPGFNHKNIEEYLKEHPYKNIKNLIDFLDDTIKQTATDRNYTYILTVIIKQLLGNKTESMKYTNKKES